MKRMFGMMPRSEIEKEKKYKDEHGLTVIVQAGPHGWTVLWADGGNNYYDVDDTTENNFQKAYAVATENLKLTEVEEVKEERKCMRCTNCTCSAREKVAKIKEEI